MAHRYGSEDVFFRCTKKQDRELWEAFSTDGEGADFVNGATVEIATKAEATALLASLRARESHERPEMLIQILSTEMGL